jgi:hypothetical protein
VVSHHLDGFLRAEVCGLVASRCRSWGSPRFAETRSPGSPLLATRGWSALRAGVSTGLAPRDAMTLRRVPPVHSRTASPRPVAPLPLGLSRDVRPLLSIAGRQKWRRVRRDPRLRGVSLRTGPLRSTPLRVASRSFLPWACVLFVARFPSAASQDFPGATQSIPEGKFRAAGPRDGGDTPTVEP